MFSEDSPPLLIFAGAVAPETGAFATPKGSRAGSYMSSTPGLRSSSLAEQGGFDPLPRTDQS